MDGGTSIARRIAALAGERGDEVVLWHLAADGTESAFTWDDLQGLIDQVGEDNVLFETDFPHPTCLYPDPLGAVEDTMNALRPETRRKVLGDNAAALYRI